MKIPQQLPQFKDQTALCIVTGSQEADFFIAHDGEIDNIGVVIAEKPVYSDREDYGGRGGSQVYETGTQREQRKGLIEADFIKKIKEELKKIVAGPVIPTVVYLFAPAEVKRDVEAALPKQLAAKLKKVVDGNFHKESPIKWLEKVRALV